MPLAKLHIKVAADFSRVFATLDRVSEAGLDLEYAWHWHEECCEPEWEIFQ